MINYYAIYDKSLNLSNNPFPARDDSAAVQCVRNMLIAAGDNILPRIVPVCDLRFVGAFDEENACFDNCVSSRLVCSLSDIPLPEPTGGDT